MRLKADVDLFCDADVLDSIINGVMAINKREEIVVCNRAAAEMLNVNPRDVIGKKIREVIPATGLPEILKTGRPEKNRRTRIGNREVFSNRSPIVRGGKIVGAVGVFQEIDEFEKLSGELESVKEIIDNLDAVIELVDDGIVVADGRGVIVRANNAYLRMTGITRDEFVGKHVHDLIRQGYMNISVTEMVLERKVPVNVIDIRNGKELLMTGSPRFNEKGEVVRVVTVVRDVTELNRLKAKLKESEQATAKYLNELKHLRSQQPFRKLITKNPEMERKIQLAAHVARVDSTVLILGESGVGKELFAELIHRASSRSQKPFIKINCGAIPANLLESEFFGYEPGSFTGALKEGKVGLFELADGGTLFLDEVGELPLDLQVKVLRAIQDKAIVRIGGKKPISLDVRIVAATNRNLEQMVKEKKFREDLYYRLNVVPIVIPPLRNRKEDILPLVAEFLARFNGRYGFQKWIHPDVMELFLEYDWPGNIRELENTIERLVVTSREDCITMDILSEMSFFGFNTPGKNSTTLKTHLENEEKRLIEEAYRASGSTRKAAQLLGISQSSLVKKMKKYHISIRDSLA